MKRCLTDQSLLECYGGEGNASDLIHLEDCLPCAARYKALERDMGLIAQSLSAPPPARSGPRFLRWRVAVPAAAVALAFIIGWSLRGASMSQLGLHPVHLTSARNPAPLELSAAEPAGSTSAIYAAYLQDAFGGDPCSEANDPLDPSCP
jgi:hypothetical protein